MEQSNVFTVPTPLLALLAEIAAEGDLGSFFFLPLIPFFPSSPVLQFVSPPGLNLSERRMVKGAEKFLHGLYGLMVVLCSLTLAIVHCPCGFLVRFLDKVNNAQPKLINSRFCAMCEIDLY